MALVAVSRVYVPAPPFGLGLAYKVSKLPILSVIFAPNVVPLPSKVTLVSWLMANALLPMEVTLAGMVTLVSWLLKNA